MGHRPIEISLRAVMDYLSGLIDREEFERIVPGGWPAISGHVYRTDAAFQLCLSIDFSDQTMTVSLQNAAITTQPVHSSENRPAKTSDAPRNLACP